MATLHGITGGRASFSIGRGDGAVKVLKRKPMRVAEFEAYLATLQAYLRGEDVEVDGVVDFDGSRLRHRSVAAHRRSRSIDVAATGPRTVEVAAKTADGVSFSVGADVERLAQERRAGSRDLRQDRTGLRVASARVLSPGGGHRRRPERARGDPRPRGDARSILRVGAEAHRRRQRARRTRPTVTPSTRWNRSTTRRAGASPSGRVGDQGKSTSTRTRPAATSSSTSSRSRDRPSTAPSGSQEIIELGITRFMIGTRAVGVDLDESNAIRIGREVFPLLRR